MKEEIIKKLKTFIKENPPLDKEGKPKWWSKSEWEENLSKEIPNWKDILKSVDIWKDIKGIKPRRDYDDLLGILLEYAPPEILKEYITSNDSEERKVTYKILTKDNARKLTSSFWKLLDDDTKIWLMSKVSEEILERPYPRFLEDLDILIHDPEYFFERLRQRCKIVPWIHPHVISLAFTEAIFYEELSTIHPLWIKLKATIEEANDLSSMKRIEEIERKFRERIQWIIDKLESIFPILQYQYPIVSNNILFDSSLLLEADKAKKVFNFMREYYKDFNFFISSSFYHTLKGENRLYKIARFFEQEKEISPQELLGMLEEHKQYYTIFEIPREVYQKKYWHFYKSLREEIEDRDLIEILFEEWVFLQEFSWIVAKSKKTFEKFKEAGAVVIEFSEKAVDKIIKRTLKKKDDEFVNTFDKLRALGKWVAVGGASATSLMNPGIGALVGFGAGIFLLLDPERDYLSWEVREYGDGV